VAHTPPQSVQVNDEQVDGTESIIMALFLKSRENLCKVFCDVDDLSFHNIENVVNLESMFVDETTPHLEVASWDTWQDQNDSEIYSFQLKSTDLETCAMFLPLQQWTSFLPPFNSDQRGGQRLIFRSQVLADRLTEALKKAKFGFGLCVCQSGVSSQQV